MANLGDFVSIPAQSNSSPTFIPYPIPSAAPAVASYAAPMAAYGAPAIVDGGLGTGEGGLLSTLLLLGLIGGNGFGNNRKDCVDQASLNALQGSFDTNSILSKLASIEAAVPYNEAQVQLALAGLGDQLTRTITNGQNVLQQNQFALQLQEANSTSAIQSQLAGNTASVLAGLNSVDTNVDHTGMSIINAIRDDGNATRAVITENVIQGLRDDKVILANEVSELRNERNRDRDRHGIEINMINNQNQNQLQFQQQQQLIGNLTHCMGEALQSIRATNSAINIGGTQLASPTNTNTNVRG